MQYQTRETDMAFDLATFTAKARANKAAAEKRPEVYQAPDGTWKHRFSFAGGFADRTSAETDLRFCKEWGCK